MVHLQKLLIFAVLIEFSQTGELNFILNPNPVASFLYGGRRIRIWASAQNGQDVKSSEWNFRYDPIVVPVFTKENKIVTTTNRGSNWITEFTLALDDEKASLQALLNLKDVYGNITDILPNNVYALPVKYIQIDIPNLFEEVPEARLNTQTPCREKSACIYFSGPKFQFRVTIVSQTQDKARKIEQLLNTVSIHYKIALAASTRKSTGGWFDHLLGVECKPFIETMAIEPMSDYLELFNWQNFQLMPNSARAEINENIGNCSSGFDMLKSLNSIVEQLVDEVKRQSRKSAEINHEGFPMQKSGSKTRPVMDFTNSFKVGLDCSDIFRRQHAKKSGVYLIHPPNLVQGPWRVYCDMEHDGGGWTVFQVRDDVEPKENFTRNWEDYKLGFGDFDREFWLGNILLWALTNVNKFTKNELLILLEDFEGVKAFARYQDFKIGSEKEKFQLFIGVYNGSKGDSLVHHNGSKFSTVDADNDGSSHHCAERYKGGWWYGTCYNANLNGRYFPGASVNSEGMCWNEWRYGYSLKKTIMKFRHRQDEILTTYDLPELLSNANILTKPK